MIAQMGESANKEKVDPLLYGIKTLKIFTALLVINAMLARVF